MSVKSVLSRLRGGSKLKKVTEHTRLSTIVVPAIVPDARAGRRIAMATVIKNEGRYLAEWIDFHRFLGVDHFYIYDNGSADNGPAVLKPYVDAGIVTLIPWRNYDVDANMQSCAYAHALGNLGEAYRWIGFFDVDEFVFPTRRASLVETLAGLEKLPVLGVLGVPFGTSAHAEPPEAPVTEAYRYGVPLKTQNAFPRLYATKCFVQPPQVEAVINAHYFRIRGETAVCYTETGAPLYGSARHQADALSCDVIRYNHYFTRSASEFAAKRERASVRGPRFQIEAGLRQGLFDAIESLNVEDRTIDVHLPAFNAWRSQRRSLADA